MSNHTSFDPRRCADEVLQRVQQHLAGRPLPDPGSVEWAEISEIVKDQLPMGLDGRAIQLTWDVVAVLAERANKQEASDAMLQMLRARLGGGQAR